MAKLSKKAEDRLARKVARAVIAALVERQRERSERQRKEAEAREQELRIVHVIDRAHAGESARRAGYPEWFGRAVLRRCRGDVSAVAVLFRAAARHPIQ